MYLCVCRHKYQSERAEYFFAAFSISSYVKSFPFSSVIKNTISNFLVSISLRLLFIYSAILQYSSHSFCFGHLLQSFSYVPQIFSSSFSNSSSLVIIFYLRLIGGGSFLVGATAFCFVVLIIHDNRRYCNM